MVAARRGDWLALTRMALIMSPNSSCNCPPSPPCGEGQVAVKTGPSLPWVAGMNVQAAARFGLM